MLYKKFYFYFIAGFPYTVVLSLTFEITDEFTPTVAHSPIKDEGITATLDAKKAPSAIFTNPVISQCDDIVHHCPILVSCPTDVPIFRITKSSNKLSHVNTQFGHTTHPTPNFTFLPTYADG